MVRYARVGTVRSAGRSVDVECDSERLCFPAQVSDARVCTGHRSPDFQTGLTCMQALRLHGL